LEHKDVLTRLKAGELDNEMMKVMEATAFELTAKYKIY